MASGKFTVDTHLFRELGELLVGRDSTALVELIKNAYDADAEKVTIHRQDLDDQTSGSITIRDSGSGMTRDQFEQGFLRVASRLKDEGDRRSQRYKRRYTGAKGIGRLAAHKLARQVEVYSIPDLSLTDRDALGVDATIDWDQIERCTTFDEIEPSGAISVDEVGRSKTATSGTTITLRRLRRKWTPSERSRFFAEVQTFNPPPELVEPPASVVVKGDQLLFQRAHIADANARDPGFTVDLTGDFESGDEYWPASCKVYTPDDLAAALAEAVGDKPKARWLEPSHGRGAFLRAIAALGVKKERVTAIDLDRSHSHSDRLACTARGVDFLEWSRNTKVVFDRIIGNPPFVAIRRLPPELQQTAASILGPDGKQIGTGGNLWQAFVLASLRILAPGGSLGFVLPSAAEFADYSTGLRGAVRDQFDVLELYRCRRPLFDDVQEGTVVVIARGFGGGPCRFRRKEVATREELIGKLQRGPAVRRSRCPVRQRPVSRASATLGDFATIRLGGVTGDAGFFLLTESERKAADLPMRACTPVVSRSRHVKAATIDTDSWRRLKANDERVWLFNPPDDALVDPAVQRRLNLDPSAGGCNRKAFKVAARNPWYRTPMPGVPDAFISGMQADGPWLTLNMMPDLNATNTLYVVHFADQLAEKERFAIALAFLTTKVRKQLVRKARRYADGLWKYEPGTLRTILIPNISSCGDCRNLYLQAMDALLNGDSASARRLADSRFAGPRVSSVVCTAPN